MALNAQSTAEVISGRHYKEGKIKKEKERRKEKEKTEQIMKKIILKRMEERAKRI